MYLLIYTFFSAAVFNVITAAYVCRQYKEGIILIFYSGFHLQANILRIDRLCGFFIPYLVHDRPSIRKKVKFNLAV
jgi:hypothetical protein